MYERGGSQNIREPHDLLSFIRQILRVAATKIRNNVNIQISRRILVLRESFPSDETQRYWQRMFALGSYGDFSETKGGELRTRMARGRFISRLIRSRTILKFIGRRHFALFLI